MKADLQCTRDLWFGLLLISTGTVGFGLALEGPELWFEIRDIFRRRRDRRRFFVTSPTDPPDWMKLAAFAGWALIVLGVMAEGYTEAKVSDADRNLQTFNDTLLADARKQAAEAEATARGFDVQIAQSNATAKSAEATAKKFESQIAIAQRDAAESKKEAESERLERVKLQKELEPRRLTGVQKEKLTNLLRDRPGPIMIQWASDGTEAVDFANDIGDALNKAGWKTFFGARFTFEHGIDVGAMRGSDMSILTPEIERLKQALSAIGLNSRTTIFDPNDHHSVGGFEKNVLYLVIDHKPETKHTP